LTYNRAVKPGFIRVGIDLSSNLNRRDRSDASAWTRR
jgi:hypothetical protein